MKKLFIGLFLVVLLFTLTSCSGVSFGTYVDQEELIITNDEVNTKEEIQAMYQGIIEDLEENMGVSIDEVYDYVFDYDVHVEEYAYSGLEENIHRAAYVKIDLIDTLMEVFLRGTQSEGEYVEGETTFTHIINEKSLYYKAERENSVRECTLVINGSEIIYEYYYHGIDSVNYVQYSSENGYYSVYSDIGYLSEDSSISFTIEEYDFNEDTYFKFYTRALNDDLYVITVNEFEDGTFKTYYTNGEDYNYGVTYLDEDTFPVQSLFNNIIDGTSFYSSTVYLNQLTDWSYVDNQGIHFSDDSYVFAMGDTTFMDYYVRSSTYESLDDNILNISYPTFEYTSTFDLSLMEKDLSSTERLKKDFYMDEENQIIHFDGTKISTIEDVYDLYIKDYIE